MRLKKLKIHNYRSIKDLVLECQSLVTLLGPNNHGKSNVLSALEFGLSTSVKLTEGDFFHHREEDVLWVEMTFHELTEQEQSTFSRYIRSDGSVCVRKSCKMELNQLETSYNGYLEQPEEPWLHTDNVSDYLIREKIGKTPLVDYIPPKGNITKSIAMQAQQKYIEEHRDELNFTNTLANENFLGQKNIGGGVLPDYYLIPAVRDLTDEVKVKSTTTFGRLLSRSIQEMMRRDEGFIEVRNQLTEIISSLNNRVEGGEGTTNELERLERTIEDELRAWGVSVDIKVTAPEIERVFELGTDLHLDDGIQTTADRKGHGLQRAVIFALLRSWAKVLRSNSDGETVARRKQSESVIFAIEEPELFLHPHAQRRLSASLRVIAQTSEHQVFVCTHSTHFVDLKNYKEIGIVNKENPKLGSTLRQCSTEIFPTSDLKQRKKRFQMAEWINPDRAELFFSSRVVFVEGETERVLIPYLAKQIEIYDSDVSIVDCGSKFNLPLYVAIAKAFKIPYVVIHDEDPLPDPVPEDWNRGKVDSKKRTYDLNLEIAELVDGPLGVIEVLAPNLEQVGGISKNQGEKKGKAMAALDYFSEKKEHEIPKRLLEVVRTIYAGVQTDKNQ